MTSYLMNREKYVEAAKEAGLDPDAPLFSFAPDYIAFLIQNGLLQRRHLAAAMFFYGLTNFMSYTRGNATFYTPVTRPVRITRDVPNVSVSWYVTGKELEFSREGVIITRGPRNEVEKGLAGLPGHCRMTQTIDTDDPDITTAVYYYPECRGDKDVLGRQLRAQFPTSTGTKIFPIRYPVPDLIYLVRNGELQESDIKYMLSE